MGHLIMGHSIAIRASNLLIEIMLQERIGRYISSSRSKKQCVAAARQNEHNRRCTGTFRLHVLPPAVPAARVLILLAP